MFHDFCQSVTLVFCQRTHVSHDHHPRGPCCSRARISYDEPCMGAIFYQKIFASALSPVLNGSVSWAVPSYSAAPGRRPSSPPSSSRSNERSKPLAPCQMALPRRPPESVDKAPSTPNPVWATLVPRLMAMGRVRARARLLSLLGSGSNCAVTASKTPKL